MNFVQDVIINDRLAAHTWELVRSEIARLHARPASLTIFLGGANGQMTMEYVKGHGYYVSTFGEGELEEWLLVDTEKPANWIMVSIAQHEDEIPQNVLVPDAIVLEAAEEFYRTGKRSVAQTWVKSLELMKCG